MSWEPDCRPHLLEREVRELVRRHDAGESFHAIAVDIDRHHTTVAKAVRGWKAGTTRMAKRAQRRGTWKGAA